MPFAVLCQGYDACVVHVCGDTSDWLPSTLLDTPGPRKGAPPVFCACQSTDPVLHVAPALTGMPTAVGQGR